MNEIIEVMRSADFFVREEVSLSPDLSWNMKEDWRKRMNEKYLEKDVRKDSEKNWDNKETEEDFKRHKAEGEKVKTPSIQCNPRVHCSGKSIL